MVSGSNLVGVSRVRTIITAAIALPLLVSGFQTAPGSADSQDSIEAVESAGLDVVVDQAEAESQRDTGLAEADANLAVRYQDELTSLDLKVMKELSAVQETPKIIFHYRPGDLDDESLARVVKINLEKFDQCEKLLQMKYEGRVHIFLYRDSKDLQQLTGTGATAFATGDVSVHQSIDFESVHELTHIFALQFPSDEDAVSDEFAIEGLATILAESDENIPIHSWAAVYQSKSRLPNLVELRRSWPAGTLPGVHPYHVAGSFVGYLIEEFGIAKVKRWYVHSTEAHMEFGKTFRRLERDWLKWLERQTVEPGHRDRILAKLGLIPEKFVSAEEIRLFDGMSVDELQSEHMSKWTVQDGRLVGRDDNAWTYIYSRQKFSVNFGLKVRFRLVEGKAVTLQLNRTDDSINHINMATWATYLSLKNGGYVMLQDLKIKPGQWNEVVVINDSGTARFYLNGLVVGEQADAFQMSEGELGIGVEGGTLEVEELVALELLSSK